MAEDEKYTEVKENLRKTLKELSDAIQKMIHENKDLPDQNFTLDVEEQSRFEAILEQEVAQLRAEIQKNILEKSYLYDVLKRECWDSVKAKGRVIKAFHLDVEVSNYSLKERTQKELQDLRTVENMRTIEMAAANMGNANRPVTPEEQKEDEQTPENLSLTGSFSAQLGHSNPYMYDQLSVITTEQRINQIILLQDLIYHIKTAFNKEFDTLHRQKVQELKRANDRNQLIRELMEELGIDGQLWEPRMADSECPERLLTVDNSEIQAEKYLTPEEEKEAERRRQEELNLLAAKKDASRERALDDMMYGVVEVKKEDILKMEVPLPECLVPITDEEIKAYEDYENKVKALDEVKDTYRKSLEGEIKKLQNSTKEATKAVDESLAKLLEKKEKCTVAIYQEELKIAYLVESLLVDEEMGDAEWKLLRKYEKIEAHKDEIVEEVKRLEEDVKVLHEDYESIVAEDKILDKDFRKDFFDVSNPTVDVLYKLFKRRPWVQKMRAQIDNNPSQSQDRRLCGSSSTDAYSKMLKAIEDLDAPENMPGGLNPLIWERFCVVRRAKVESEHQVKLKALTLAEMQALLQKRRDDEQAAHQQIETTTEELDSVHRKKNELLLDTMVQVILKQGQVELSITETSLDYAKVVLYHNNVVNRLRENVRMLGDEKIAAMEKRKEVHKGIIQQEWESRVLMETMEDLYNKARNIKLLRLSEEQREMTHLSEQERNRQTSRQVAAMEKSISYMEETQLKAVQQRMKQIEQIKRRAAKKAEENAQLEQQFPDMQLRVAELRHICEPAALEDSEEVRAEKRLCEIAKMSNLKRLAREQEKTLADLRSEVERLTLRNFPSLSHMKLH